MNAGRFNLLHHVTSTRLTRRGGRWDRPRAPNFLTWLFVVAGVIAVLDFVLDGLGWW